ncbi:type II restriction endonuclease [Prolixibacter sp. NT017]|uniref:type II restriction endonuclease n=1 Tax=Prolixibacter sp. NT017 TaxID=2652390 RepID=UPI0012754A64|nr:type II restriction endonuclease [Prolixibacter sp. NT017]GET25068.1 type II restriction endonuclease [Prolixibacter sp. NT017]
MKKLQELFRGVGFKRVSSVEINPLKSNQHELNGISPFKKLFGVEKKSFKGRFIYLPDDKEQFFEEEGTCTWYDARENHPTRTEFRLFYSCNGIFQRANEDDLLIILWKSDDDLWLILTPKDSTNEQQLIWLFDLHKFNSNYRLGVTNVIRDKDEEFAQNYILEMLGIELVIPNEQLLNEMLLKFGSHFPPTAVFSDYARKTLENIPVFEDPDEALLVSFKREEYLFKLLERFFVSKKLQQGFGNDGLDVDQFINYSLSVHNRRKSRAGYSLENHLEYIFLSHKILFSRGALTERKSKPDFLFPGIEYYRDSLFDPTFLKMLGSKTTAKDRWRQVLSEADRISYKHLITLEPSISVMQTNEMKAHNVKLVVPTKIKTTYTPEQQKDILSFSDFLEIMKSNQEKIGIMP